MGIFDWLKPPKFKEYCKKCKKKTDHILIDDSGVGYSDTHQRCLKCGHETAV